MCSTNEIFKTGAYIQKEHKKSYFLSLKAYQKSGTRDPGLLVGPEIRDPGPILWMTPGT